MTPPAPTHASTPRVEARDALTVFALLWAAASLFHLASVGQLRSPRFEAIAAMVVLFRPSSTVALLMLCAIQVAKTLTHLESVENHLLFASCVSATWLAGAAAVVLRSRRFAISRTELFETCAPVVRCSLVALYVFAVFHKLNRDWFDPAVSCGTAFYEAGLQRLPFLPDSRAAAGAAPYVAIGLEGAIPLLLAFRPTRRVGVAVGAAFHWFLAVNPLYPFYNFSAMLLALFALFVAPSEIGAVLDRVGRLRARLAAKALAWLFLGLTAASTSLLRPAFAGADLFLGLWTVYGAGFVAAALLVRPARRAEPKTVGIFRLPVPALAFLPLLVVANGITPYLGLKSDNAWSMFSNLRTEGGQSNHLLVPASVQPFGYERDLVRPIRSSDPGLQLLADRKQLVPYFVLRLKPESAATFVRDGTEYTFNRIADDPSFRPAPPLLAKILAFRSIDDEPRQSCVH